MKKRELFFIGIVEDKSKSTKEYIEKILFQEEWKKIYINEDETISSLKNDDLTVVIVNLKSEDLRTYSCLGINFDVIIYNYEIVADRVALNCKYLILNSDDESWLSLHLNKCEPLVICYGFNNKATLSVSSHNADDSSLKLYLQREITTVKDTTLEPFEFTLNVDVPNEGDIYKVLAAATTSLILDNKKFNLNI